MYLMKKCIVMPKQIMLSDTVWDEIAKRGSFGESEDDVLRRIFELPEATPDEKIQLVARPRAMPAAERRAYMLTDKGRKFINENHKPTQKLVILTLIDRLTSKKGDPVREMTLLRAMREDPLIQRSRQSPRQLLRWYQSKEFGPEELAIIQDR